MDLLIAILVWMGVIMPGSTHTQAEFDMMVQTNDQVISAVVADPVLQNDVWQSVGTNPDVVIGEGE